MVILSNLGKLCISLGGLPYIRAEFQGTPIQTMKMNEFWLSTNITKATRTFASLLHGKYENDILSLHNQPIYELRLEPRFILGILGLIYEAIVYVVADQLQFQFPLFQPILNVILQIYITVVKEGEGKVVFFVKKQSDCRHRADPLSHRPLVIMLNWSGPTTY